MKKQELLLGAIAVMGATAVVLGTPDFSFAISVPTTGTFAYDLYDIAVNKILKGPVGYVGGIAAMVIGAISLITGRVLTAVPAVLGGAALLKADTLIQGLGLVF
jgi:outer membrane receptor protein involved in Fe transport